MEYLKEPKFSDYLKSEPAPAPAAGELQAIGAWKNPRSVCKPGVKQIVVAARPWEQRDSSEFAADTVYSMPVHPYRPFLPLGLFVIGATPRTFVEDVRTGNQSHFSGPVSAEYFSNGKSFAELEQLAERGELSVPPHQHFEIDVVDSGQSLIVQMRGPFSGVALWGLAQVGPVPSQSVDVKCEGSEHVGTIVEHRLRGDEVVLTVRSPTESGCCRLLESFRRRGWGEERG
jgi:hypothetical protein